MKTNRTMLAFALLLLVVFACRPKAPQTAGGAQTGASPSTSEVLALTPESAIVAIAIPSVDSAYAQLESLLLRGSPDDVDMKAELNVLRSQFARSIGVFDATTAEDIALARGIDPGKPIGLFFGPVDPTATAGGSRQPVLDELLRRFGMNQMAPFAVVLPYAKRQDAEKMIADWGGSGQFDSRDLPGQNTTIFTADDGGFSYFFTDSVLVAGTSPVLVSEIADRLKAPASVRYGTPECPAESVDELVMLSRTDRLALGGVELPETIQNMLPEAARSAANDAWEGLVAPYSGDDPLVTTMRFSENTLTVRSRLDYAKHPDAQQRLAPASPLKHAAMLPKRTLAAYSLQFTSQMKQGLKEQIAANAGSSGGLVGQLTQSLGQVVDEAGDEVTLAVTGPGAGTSNLALLIEFRNGESARALLKELGMTPLIAETYNNIPIYSFILPDASIYYALPENTFVVGGSLDTVKNLIDAVNSGKGGFADAVNVDSTVPRKQLLIATRGAVEDALVPAAQNSGMLSGSYALTASKSLQKLENIRLTTEVVGNWQDTRLGIQLQ